MKAKKTTKKRSPVKMTVVKAKAMTMTKKVTRAKPAAKTVAKQTVDKTVAKKTGVRSAVRTLTAEGWKRRIARQHQTKRTER